MNKLEKLLHKPINEKNIKKFSEWMEKQIYKLKK